MRALATAVLLSLLVVPAGALAGPREPEPRGRKTVRSLAERRREGVVRQRWDLSCGAAAMSTLLTFHVGDPVTEAEVVMTILQRADPVKIRAREGFSLLDLKRFAESRGHVADGYGRLNLPHLERLAPAIVATRIGGYDHFVVFLGVEDGHVLLADPAFGNRTMTVERFEALWPRRIAFVVRGAGETRRPAGLAPPEPAMNVAPAAAVREALGVLR